MSKKLLVVAAVLVLLAAAGAGGWWLAADRGWIAGKPNSPRAENFKRAIDAHLARTANANSPPCAPVSAERARDGMGPPGVRYDWSPASFLHVVDPRQPGSQAQAQRYALLARHGYFAATAAADGSIAYTLSWKGMAASPGQNCIRFAGSERAAQVLSHAKKRSGNGVDVYEVVARPVHTHIEPWAQTPEFRTVFNDAGLARVLEPQPVAFELARGAGGFEVIAEQGRAVPDLNASGGLRPAVLARLAGGLTAERVRAALEAWAASPHGVSQTRLCLRLPEMHQADEVGAPPLDPLNPARGAAPGEEGLVYTYYNLLTRAPQQQEALRGYVLMKTLEELGLASSSSLPAAEFRGQPAAGAVRFAPGQAFREQYAKTRERCLPIANLYVEEVVHFEAIGEFRPAPSFLARMKAKPYDEATARVYAAFPHFARLQETGAVLRGTLQFRMEGEQGTLQVANGNVLVPVFHPDITEVRLPAVEAPPPVPAGRAAKPAAAGPPSGPAALRAAGPAPSLEATAGAPGSELLGRLVVSANNARAMEARRALLHPGAMQCAVGEGANRYQVELQKQFRQRIGDYRLAAGPIGEPPWRDRYDYPVTPTHRLQILFDRAGDPPRTYAGSIEVLMARHGERWLEVIGCPKRGGVPRTDGGGYSSAQRVQALAAGLPPSLRAEIVDLMRQGRRSDAIRRFQAATGEDVLTGHDVVDQLMRSP
ncbi:MAG: hypothetical protein IPK29_09605 [Betaproteobacteria bacterium]|nr:hypothetical protein [Betaproteobacteria bacterium]